VTCFSLSKTTFLVHIAKGLVLDTDLEFVFSFLVMIFYVKLMHYTSSNKLEYTFCSYREFLSLFFAIDCTNNKAKS